MQLYPMWQVCNKTYTSSGVNGGSVAEWALDFESALIT